MKLYIILRNRQEDSSQIDEHSQKMIITIDGNSRLNDLKKLIEKEYFNVYPFQQNFICENVQDEFGYNLTLCDSLENFVKNNDRIIVEYSTEYNNIDNGKKQYQAYQLLQNLQQFQASFSKLLVSCDLQQSEKEKIVDLIHKIFFMCFSTDLKIQKSVNIFFKEFCQKTNFQKFLKISEKLNYLTTQAIMYWCQFYLESNALNYLIVENVSYFINNDNIKTKVKQMGLASIITKQIGNQNLSPGVKKQLLIILKKLSQQYNSQSSLAQKNKQIDYEQNTDYFKKDSISNISSSKKQSVDCLDLFTQNFQNQKIQQNNAFAKQSKRDTLQENCIKNFFNKENNSFNQKLHIDPNFLTSEKDTQFYQEYLELLHPIVDQNLQYFAIKNLASNIDQTIYDIMENSKEFINLSNIFKIQVPDSMCQDKKQIIEAITNNIKVERAKDLANYNFVNTILTALNTEKEQLRNSYLILLQTLLRLSDFTLDFTTIFNLLKSEIYEVRISSAQIFKRMTEKMDQNNFMQYGDQLETYLVELFDMLKSRNTDQEMQRLLVNILSNLCLVDYIKPQIIYLEGVQILISKLRSPQNCIETKRASMRGLFNLSSKSRETKIKILSELNYEFEQLCSQTLDPVIQSFLTALLKANQIISQIIQGSFSSIIVSDILNFQIIL